MSLYFPMPAQEGNLDWRYGLTGNCVQCCEERPVGYRLATTRFDTVEVAVQDKTQRIREALCPPADRSVNLN